MYSVNDNEIVERFQEGIPSPQEFACIFGLIVPSNRTDSLSAEFQLRLEEKLSYLKRFTKSRELFERLAKLEQKIDADGIKIQPFGNFLEDYQKVNNFSRAYQEWLIAFLGDCSVSVGLTSLRQYVFEDIVLDIIKIMENSYGEGIRTLIKLIRFVTIKLKECDGGELYLIKESQRLMKTASYEMGSSDIFRRVFQREISENIVAMPAERSNFRFDSYGSVEGPLVLMEAAWNGFEGISLELAKSIFGDV